jgi:hypothetical protein
MISIDPKMQAISSSTKLGRTSKKEKDIKFNTGKKTQGATHSEAASGVVDVGGILFLQEIDQFTEDRGNLEEFAKKAFKILRDLQLDLLEGKISGRRLHNLKDTINSSKLNIASPELSDFARQIALRIEVEIAKIEVNEK